ncbi:hypothetical protein N866_08230 [Actinotalea ferrariae CF5-4]|uniref:Uncharacterized protein n=1 Tax=Actinotalea ferrariae CF5-4 TaxID=948458 RepID=A0A021VMP6_9CELL|nr:hypothetical protein [Actinotalea ferrariae]EYR62484.1 hypothetical protein N866_08230 [Actinotalea ferrariae CF5-4]
MTFLEEVAAALEAAGRAVDVDPDTATIDVADDAVGRVLAVVRPVARAVTLYAVHPRTVPADGLGPVGELTLRATADLLDAALELDLATGAVAARFPVVLGGLEADTEVLGDLLGTALEIVVSTLQRYTEAIDDVGAGRVDARTAAVAVRTAPVEELTFEL